MRYVLASIALGLVPVPVAAQQASGPPVTVGLALSGGSAKGIAHVGVLKTLERLGVRIDVVAGTSMGAVVGGLYALDLSVDSIEQFFASAEWTSLIGDGVPRERRFLDQRRLDERAVLSVPLERRRVSLPAGAIVGSNLMRRLEHVTWRAATVRRFADLPRPFVAVATDIETGEAVVLREGVLSEALRASTGVPGAVEPFRLGDRLLVDGALSRNLPASDARELGADVVICSDVSDPLDSAEELQSVLDVLSQLASLSMLDANIEQRRLCDVLIRPDVEGMSGLDFERVQEWVSRGVAAAELEQAELRRIAARPGPTVRTPMTAALSPGLLGDSVLITGIEVAGTSDPRVVRLVRRELELAPGAHVGRAQMESRLGDLDATGLFGLVRYRLDGAEGGAAMTVTVEERPRDRLGVGLRYDDERRASLLFTASLHNLLGYGSLTRLDLRVGEETQIGASFNRHRGVTGRFEVGLSAQWSQGRLDLGAAQGGRVGVEVSSAAASLGLAARRGTYLGVEARGERTVSSSDALSVSLVSGTAVLDHETLDRIDFPQRGADVSARLEWGGANVTDGRWFSVAVVEARYFAPIHPQVTVDVGAMVGNARGSDLPPHRRFYLGGAHRSAVFRATQPTFQGLESQEHSGRALQLARVGLRVEVRSDVFVRGGLDVGAVREVWELPLARPMTGWALSVGSGTLVGPVLLEVSRLGSGRDPRVAISVGRQF